MIDMTTARADTVDKYAEFLREYQAFRECVGLSDSIDSGEGFKGAIDKLGRLAREIKHFERNDPRENWVEEAEDAAAGLIVYIVLLVQGQGLSTVDGLRRELAKAAMQHGSG